MTIDNSADREMLIRIDEQVKSLRGEVATFSNIFREQMATKPEVAAVILRVGRLETMTNLVIGTVIVAIIGAIMTLILKGGLS